MSTGKDRVIRAAQQCEESGYERNDGKWVDPIPVQQVAIEEGFRRAMEKPEYDLWTDVHESTLRDGNTVAENFQRVVDTWADKAEDILAESPVVEELRRKQSEMEQD